MAVALEVFKTFLMHRCVLLFTDNQCVLGTMVRCWSDNKFGNGLARIVCSRVESMFAHIWFERVPSLSNPADAPSRGEVPSGGFQQRACVPADLVARLLQGSCAGCHLTRGVAKASWHRMTPHVKTRECCCCDCSTPKFICTHMAELSD